MKRIYTELVFRRILGIMAILLTVAMFAGCGLGSNTLIGTEKVPGNSAANIGLNEPAVSTSPVAGGNSGAGSMSPQHAPQATPTASTGAEKLPGTGNDVNKLPAMPKKVPILYYHAINEETFGIKELFVKPDMFEKQMEYLKLNNYTPIHFEQLENLDKIEKPIIISFDDGYVDNYTVMYPILKKFGYKAVIFPIIDMVGQPNYLTWEQINSMRDLISFQNHTVTHRELIYLDTPAIEKEMSEANRVLEEKTGQKISTVSYPIGLYNTAVKAAAKKYFKYGVTTDSGLYEPGGDKYQMPRIYVQRSDSLERFVNMVKGLED